jgi:LmbE family N-acetylglucosaminyl deacetylase
MNYKGYLLNILVFFPLFLSAQTQRSYNAAEIKQGLEALNVTGRVLYIAAHPDDENTRLLAYYSKGMKFRTAYLSLTRGDGGQNLIGTEQADLLGLVRTQELLAARKIDGAEQYFSRANDFGFSKTSAESLKFWDEKQVLGDVVWVIRTFQPDVIITRFPEDARAGHGAHAGSAILAKKAFLAAADPKQYPEQLKKLKVWKTKRIVWNTFNFSGTNTTSDSQLKLDVGVYNPLLGQSYGEIAADSRSNHRSQGFGSAKQRGTALEYFEHLAGEQAKVELFENINVSLNRYPGMEATQLLLNEINQEFKVDAPYKSLEKLLKLKALTAKATFDHAKLDELILACAGIWVESLATAPVYAIGDSIEVQVQAISRLPKDFPYPLRIRLANGQGSELKTDRVVNLRTSVAASTVGLTQPYWLANKHGIGFYEFSGYENLATAENTPPTIGALKIIIGDAMIEVNRPIVYKYTNPARGEIYQPLIVAPPITATLKEKAYVFNNQLPAKITVSVKAFAVNSKGTLEVKVPPGWSVSPASIPLAFEEKGEARNIELTVTPGAKAGKGMLQLQVKMAGTTYAYGFQQINYEHIPLQTLFPAAEARLEQIDLKFARKNIGYLAGAGDLVPQSLKQIGFHVTILEENLLATTDLSAFDAIVTGVRLYNVSEQIAALQPKLMDYVKNGGTLVQQYNVNSPLKTNQLGPYPFSITRDRVTEEDSKVTILKPEHSILNFPNKITQQDFEGWVQERGIYFVDNLDSHYTPILSMQDQGESPKQGSLIVADYGKGKYIYTGLVFYRELPAGVPGAYRLFVNLLSAGASK